MNTTIPIIELQERGILLPSGEINANKLNHLSGAMAAPFVETLWEISGENSGTLNRLYDIMSGLYEQGRENEIMEVLHLLYDTMGLIIPADVVLLSAHAEARSHFLFELLVDIDDVMQELLPDE